MLEAKRTARSIEELNDPLSTLWHAHPALKVSLVPASIEMQPSSYIRTKWRDEDYGHVRSAGLQIAHTGKEIALRLEWEQEQPPRVKEYRDNDDFPDAAAVLFPLHEKAPIFMGGPDAPVGIWHWKSDARDDRARVNTADGIGRSRLLESSDVRAHAHWQGGHWHLVFTRSLKSAYVNATPPEFPVGSTLRAGFAVWDGSRQERAGLKAFSPLWTEFVLRS